jgi:hypothetical protein
MSVPLLPAARIFICFTGKKTIRRPYVLVVPDPHEEPAVRVYSQAAPRPAGGDLRCCRLSISR